ncbi:MAG: FAD-binding oxidoreductase [Sneathiella sp.]|nr:FAD-binding oxidoreductase [Sneathiella sp.]
MTNSLNYYEDTAHKRLEFPVLKTLVSVDVCVIGAGFTGLGTALELADRGLSVAVLEAKTVGYGASGRNGGQIASGYAPGMMETEQIVGLDDARKLWDFSEQAKEILFGRIAKYNIDCDLRSGELYAAPKKSHLRWLEAEKAFCEDRYGYESYRWVNQEKMRVLLAGERYVGGLLDKEGGHLHPLNYVLGLAKAAKKAGVQIFENSAALSIDEKPKVLVSTENGSVSAGALVLAGNAYLDTLEVGSHNKILPVKSSILATGPLGEERAKFIMATEACVADTYFDLDYFKMTPDTRLIYGGQDISFGSSGLQNNSIRRNMLKTFPMLADVKVQYLWSGLLAATRQRLPDVGRKTNNIYYAHGYSGQGVPLSAIISRILAEAICGEMAGIDIFGRIPHKIIPKSKALQIPLFYLTLLWQKIKDRL